MTRPRPAPVRSRPARRPRAARLGALWLAAALLGGTVYAQPRAQLEVGMAGAPVAGAWNPLRATVRDAPGARLALEIDVGGLERGEVLQRAEWSFPAASGVQRLDVDVPLPAWRRLAWRIEYDGRVLASGALGARERDERPLALVVSAAAPERHEALLSGGRPVRATAADLSHRAAAWDGVELLLFDGTAAAPEPAVVLAAATAGVRVLLPPEPQGGYAALASLLEPGGLRVGAGGIAALPGRATGDGAPGPEGLALATDARRALVDAAIASLPATGWNHLPRALVIAIAGGYAALAWILFRVGGPAGASSGLVFVTVAGLVAPWAAPDDPAPVREGAVVVAAGGLGVRTDLREVARLPRGEVVLPAPFAPVEPSALRWVDGATRLPLAPGGRARLTGAPALVAVPDDVREAGEGTPADALPEPLAAALPPGMRAIASGSTWWLLRDEATADARAGAPR